MADPHPIPQVTAQLSVLQPTALGHLLIDPAQHPRGQAHMSAASGLVRVRQRLYVVADDEMHVGVFDDPIGAGTGLAPGTLLRVLPGDLPLDKGKRKKVKPDLESLTALPRLPGCPAGALLALGSGSRPERETAVLLVLNDQGIPNGRLALLDLAALYAPLRARFADLNIEGALVVSGELLLLQRGNQGDARNACIRYDWNQMAPWLAGLQTLPPPAKAVQLLDLGCVAGVPLGLTDGTALGGGVWAFCAVAESTHNSYQDGACVASAIGTVGPDGVVQRLQLLQGAPKVEGIAAVARGPDWVLSLVTDPDDPAVASQLLQVCLTQVHK